MLHNTTSGGWGFAIRRMLDAAARNILWMALLFVPILLFGIHPLYEWADAELVAGDPILQHKSIFLNRTFFTIRTFVYFAVWAGLAYVMLRSTAGGVRTIRLLRSERTLSGVGLGVYVLTMSFAAFDWAMSLEPHWFSTIYGVLFIVGQGLSTFCLTLVVAKRLSKFEVASEWFPRNIAHDLGNLTLAFVMLWAYMSLSQFLIIWSGNLPEETPWYLTRLGDGWQAIALSIVAFHFVLPFLILLNRKSKQNLKLLGTIAGAILLVRFIEIYWLVSPAYHGQHHGEMHISWMDLVAPFAIGGLWVGWFLQHFRRRPLTPPEPLGLHIPKATGDPESHAPESAEVAT